MSLGAEYKAKNLRNAKQISKIIKKNTILRRIPTNKENYRSNSSENIIFRRIIFVGNIVLK